MAGWGEWETALRAPDVVVSSVATEEPILGHLRNGLSSLPGIRAAFELLDKCVRFLPGRLQVRSLEAIQIREL